MSATDSKKGVYVDCPECAELRARVAALEAENAGLRTDIEAVEERRHQEVKEVEHWAHNRIWEAKKAAQREGGG